jgi:peptidoglycan/LPS O-acetylase OafA/YrhL
MASGAFASNVFFGYQIDYFDARSAEQPLLHIWSLGVEEQFYVIWPVILVTLNSRFSEKVKATAVTVMLVASLSYSEF